MDPPSSNKRTHSHAHSEFYRECQRNHAAALGAHATDGCGEFIAAPTSDPADPTSLKCVACGCHRNFHRKEEVEDGEEEKEEEEEEGSHVLLTLKTGGMRPACCSNLGRGKNKRFRSRFTREQKKEMMELAERLGWSLQRKDEGLVEEGCRKIGVERGVFKVWMHNNKQAVLEMKSRNESLMVVKRENNEGSNGDKVNGENGLNYSSPSPSPN